MRLLAKPVTVFPAAVQVSRAGPGTLEPIESAPTTESLGPTRPSVVR